MNAPRPITAGDSEHGPDAAAWWQVLLAGILHALAWWLVFPTVGWWWLAFLIPVPLVWASVRARRRRTLVWAVGGPVLVAWLAHQSWVGAVSGLGLLPFCLVLTAWTPILAIAIRRLARSPRLARWPLAVLVPPVWVLVEEFRADLAFDGYPWYLLGQPLVEWPPLAQVADLGGVILVAVLPAAIGALAVDLLLHRGSPRARLLAVVAVAALSTAWVGYGLFRVGGGSGRPGPTILAVQTNLPQSNKVGWTPDAQWRDANEFAARTVEAVRAAEAAGSPVDLVVWPETMLPGVGLEAESIDFMASRGWWPGDRFAELAVQLQSIVGRPLLLGSGSYEGLRLGEDGETVDWDGRFNSVYLLDDGGIDAVSRYDKMVLTPFGETMPYISAWPWLESRLLEFGARGMRFDLVAGTRFVRFDVPGGVGESFAVATPICFEDTVPQACRRLVYQGGEKVADLLVNPSNDGWFGDHDGARDTHLQLARLRCIENRVPMVRAVNTGRSAWIDSNGVLRASLPSMESGELVATVELDDRVPPFARLARWPVAILAITGFGLLVSARSRAVESGRGVG